MNEWASEAVNQGIGPACNRDSVYFAKGRQSSKWNNLRT